MIVASVYYLPFPFLTVLCYDTRFHCICIYIVRIDFQERRNGLIVWANYIY
jgi:hypothetical protein